MTDHYRGPASQETPMGRWWRHRWVEGSIYVLDIDRVVCPPDASRGLLVEEKYAASEHRYWRVTRQLARNLGWWSALIVYETDSGRAFDGDVTKGHVHLINPVGKAWHLALTDERFDTWVCRAFGAIPRGSR